MAVRKRFIGDVNSTIAVRGTSNSQTARGLVYADGLLLSNFLGNTFTFRAALVDGLRRRHRAGRRDLRPVLRAVSGQFDGRDRRDHARACPTHFEADAKVQGFTQHFDLFGVNRSFNGTNTSATIGDKVGRLSYLIGVDHLENTSQPLQFATLAQSATPAKATDRPVTGAYFYNDQNNARTAVLGVSSEGIERTFQDQFRLKLAYDLTPTLQAGFTLGYWHQKYNSDTQTFLRDANGNPVYSGLVNIGGFEYNVPAATFAPSRGASENFLYGVSLRHPQPDRVERGSSRIVFRASRRASRARPPPACPATAPARSHTETAAAGNRSICDRRGRRHRRMRVSPRTGSRSAITTTTISSTTRPTPRPPGATAATRHSRTHSAAARKRKPRTRRIRGASCRAGG